MIRRLVFHRNVVLVLSVIGFAFSESDSGRPVADLSYLRKLKRCINSAPVDANHLEFDRCLSGYEESGNEIERNSGELSSRKPYLLTGQVGTVVKPSSQIQGETFTSACSNNRAILASDPALLFTSDGFVTYRKITVHPQFLTNGDTVESVALTKASVYLVIGGKLFVYQENSTALLYFEQATNMNSDIKATTKILGVSGPAICYVDNYEMIQNDHAYVWDRYTIFRIRSNPTEFYRVVFEQSPGYNITDVQLLANPDYVAVTTLSAEHAMLQRCYIGESQDSCEIVAAKATLTNEFRVQALASAVFDLLLWNHRNITLVGNKDSIEHTFDTTSVVSVQFSSGKNTWFVKTSDNELFYGQIHATKPLKLNLTHTINSSAIFLSDDLIGVVSYSFGDISEMNIHDINSLKRTKIQPQISIQPETTSSNCLLLSGLSSSVTVQFGAVASVDDSFKIEAYERYGKLRVSSTIESVMTTVRVSYKTVLQEKKLSITLSPNCSQGTESCPRGFGLIELVYLPKMTAMVNPTATHVQSRLYVVSTSCPIGRHLRLDKNSPGLANCTMDGKSCHLAIRKNDNLYLKFQIWQGDNFVDDVREDILLTETQKRTGFHYHDYNLIRKTCYQCSNIRPRPSPWQIILQTVESACPCNADTIEGRWIANLSFLDVYSSSDRNILRFRSQVISHSFCELSTNFTVELTSHTDLIYHYLEYVSIAVCVGIVLALLSVSYCSYFKRTRDKQIRLSVFG